MSDWGFRCLLFKLLKTEETVVFFFPSFNLFDMTCSDIGRRLWAQNWGQAHTNLGPERKGVRSGLPVSSPSGLMLVFPWIYLIPSFIIDWWPLQAKKGILDWRYLNMVVPSHIDFSLKKEIKSSSSEAVGTVECLMAVCGQCPLHWASREEAPIITQRSAVWHCTRWSIKLPSSRMCLY